LNLNFEKKKKKISVKKKRIAIADRIAKMSGFFKLAVLCLALWLVADANGCILKITKAECDDNLNFAKRDVGDGTVRDVYWLNKEVIPDPTAAKKRFPRLRVRNVSHWEK
jgi:hypothetical protein